MRLLTAATLALLLAACASGAVEPRSSESNDSGSSVESASTGPVSGPAGVPGGSEMSCWGAAAAGAGGADLSWSNTSEQAAVVQPLTGMHGHAAIWTDVNGDDLADLYVGTFADRDVEIYQERGAEGPSPDRLLINQGGRFEPDGSLPEMLSRTSGGVGVDLDGDADLDLVVSRNFRDAGAPPTEVLVNEGGTMAPVPNSGIPEDLGGRSVGVLDHDRDGDYDLFITEDRWSGGSSVLLRNDGNLAFSDVTAEAGIPGDVHGLAVAVSDLNGDGHPDIFVGGSNRLFVASGDGTFVEADSAQFQWEVYSEEDDVAGVSVADVNRDGLLDLAIGQHYNSTVEDGLSVPVRLYLNRGVDGNGMPTFEDVTQAAGLIDLPTKAPHVELNDYDNDGWPDLLTTASSGEGALPAVFHSEGLDGDVPVFAEPEGLGSKQYWVAGPSTDYDRDGRLDVFLVEWEPSLPSLLLHNETSGGHWLEVSVDGNEGFGIGWFVEVFAGDSTEVSDLIGDREITVTQGYSAGVLPYVHFGLGEETEVTVRLTPPGTEPIVLDEVSADQHLRFPQGCAG